MTESQFQYHVFNFSALNRTRKYRFGTITKTELKLFFCLILEMKTISKPSIRTKTELKLILCLELGQKLS